MVLGLWLTSRAWESASHQTDCASFRAEHGQLKPIDRRGRAVKVYKEYCNAAKDLDSKYHHA